MIHLAGILLATALVAASPAAAQHGYVEPVSAAVTARLRTMPLELAGLQRVDSRQGPAMFGYQGDAATDPLITVALSDARKPLDLRTAAGLGRGEAIRAGLLETLFEGKFSVAGYPGAITYFGDFVTNQGIKQSWIAEYDGVRIAISVTLYRAEDRRAVFDAIRTRLLGGAEITAKASPAELN